MQRAPYGNVLFFFFNRFVHNSTHHLSFADAIDMEMDDAVSRIEDPRLAEKAREFQVHLLLEYVHQEITSITHLVSGAVLDSLDGAGGAYDCIARQVAARDVGQEGVRGARDADATHPS